MKTRLNVRGVIVPSSYDAEWAKGYIEKGLFTPESAFRKTLDTAPKDQPIEIYINSPGGSVFAGNEMINAILQWSQATKQPVEIVVGAMAASMAANMLVQIPASKISVHKNSKIMFHGAWEITIGGSEAHADQAELLSKINADVKTALVTRTKAAPERVEQWFKEGREGWLTAEEAKAIGLAHEIVGQDAEIIKLSKSAMASLSDRGMKLAAILEGEVVEVEQAKQEAIPNEAAKPEGTAVQEVPAARVEPQGGAPAAPRVEGNGGTAPADGPHGNAAVVVPVAPVVAAVPPPANPDVIALSERCDLLEAERREWQARHDRVKTENDRLVKQIADLQTQHATILSEKDSRITGLESRLSKVTLTALAHEPEIDNWAAAMESCNGDYVLARKRYPGIYQQYMDGEQQKKGKKK